MSALSCSLLQDYNIDSYLFTVLRKCFDRSGSDYLTHTHVIMTNYGYLLFIFICYFDNLQWYIFGS